MDMRGNAELKKEKGKRKYIPFQRKLVYLAATLIGFVAVIVVPVEIKRPYDDLYQLIDRSDNLVAGVQAAFDPDDLARMNRFAESVLRLNF